MKTATKERIVGVVLIALLLWPFVHQHLTQAYLVSPWKLYGWAMYCVPSLLSVDLLDHEGARRDLAEFDENIQMLFRRFRRHHHALGLLVGPRKVAEAVARARPDYSVFVIRVDRYGFDDESFLNVAHRVHYHCHVETSGEIKIESEVIVQPDSEGQPR